MHRQKVDTDHDVGVLFELRYRYNRVLDYVNHRVPRAQCVIGALYYDRTATYYKRCALEVETMEQELKYARSVHNEMCSTQKRQRDELVAAVTRAAAARRLAVDCQTTKGIREAMRKLNSHVLNAKYEELDAGNALLQEQHTLVQTLSTELFKEKCEMAKLQTQRTGGKVRDSVLGDSYYNLRLRDMSGGASQASGKKEGELARTAVENMERAERQRAREEKQIAREIQEEEEDAEDQEIADDSGFDLFGDAYEIIDDADVVAPGAGSGSTQQYQQYPTYAVME
jgi:hypothetical protein